MATISKKRLVPAFRHLRSDPTMQTLHYRRGELHRSGQGQAFWFRPLNSAIAEVPLDDRDLPFLFQGRTSDFQTVTVTGGITYRIADADRLANRIDFAIDVDSGNWKAEPLDQIAGLVNQLAQQFVWEYLTRTALAAVLTDGVDQVRTRITEGLAAEDALNDLGIQVVAVRVADIRPDAQTQQALQTPARERIQNEADEATFTRRADAVELERAIDENTLQNEIELANRRENLITQTAANERRQVEAQMERQQLQAESQARQSRISAEEQAAQQRIAATARAEADRLAASVEQERITAVEGASVEQEHARMDLYKEMDPHILVALALQELGGTLQRIDHLTITPDMLTQAVANLTNGHGSDPR